MKTKTKTIKTNGCFADVKCTIEIEGKKFTSGGAFIGKDKNGKYGGLLYAYEKTNQVGNWDGSIKVNAIFGRGWKSNFGDIRQSVWFTYKGTCFYGVYYKSNSDIVRCRQIIKQ